jgi:predicted neuraminidase
MTRVALCAGLLAAVAPPAAADSIVVREFIYETAPFPECHASTVVETPQGIAAAWFGGTYERHPDVGIWFARRVDGRWTAPVELANGADAPDGPLPTWNPVLYQQPDGPLWLYYKLGPTPSTWWGMAMHSTDGGLTWSAPVRLPDGVIGPVKNKPVRLPNGDVLSGSSTEHDGWRVHFERSTDGGATWTVGAPIHDGKAIAAIQPSLLLHRDGRLQALGRTRQKRLFTTWSADQGRTWSDIGLMTLPNPNSGTDAVTLADGRHALVYNHCTSGRSPINLAVSTDGLTWQAAEVLEQEPGAEFSYPAVIQSRDGMLHVTYTWKRERIRYLTIDPARWNLQSTAAWDAPLQDAVAE